MNVSEQIATVLAMKIIICSQLIGLMSWYKLLLIDKASSTELATVASGRFLSA